MHLRLPRLLASWPVTALLALTTALAVPAVPAAAAPPLPDLQVRYTGDTQVARGGSFLYRLELSNNGNAATPLLQKVAVWGLLSQGYTIAYVKTDRADVSCTFNDQTRIEFEQPWASLYCVSKYPLDPGKKIVVWAKVSAPNQAGTQTFSGFVDPNNTIAESNEGNNTTVQQFQVQ